MNAPAALPRPTGPLLPPPQTEPPTLPWARAGAGPADRPQHELADRWTRGLEPLANNSRVPLRPVPPRPAFSLPSGAPNDSSATAKAPPELPRDSSAPSPARTLATACAAPPLAWPCPLSGTTELLRTTQPRPRYLPLREAPPPPRLLREPAGLKAFFVKCCAPGILLQNALFCKEGPPGALYPFTPSPFPHCLRRKSGQLATVLLIHVFSGNSALWNFTKPTCSFFPCSCVFRECSFTPIVLTFHPMVISMHSS